MALKHLKAKKQGSKVKVKKYPPNWDKMTKEAKARWLKAQRVSGAGAKGKTAAAKAAARKRAAAKGIDRRKKKK